MVLPFHGMVNKFSLLTDILTILLLLKAYLNGDEKYEYIIGMGKVESKSKPVNCKIHAQSGITLSSWTYNITDCPVIVGALSARKY
jgi:hypothetical protein